jgi:hypothetical protein
VCAGAILVQHTAWANVEKALTRLREAGAFSTPAIGLAAAFILSLLSQQRRANERDTTDAAHGIEAAVLAALIAALALGICFSLAGGFGVALCAIGMLAAGPFAATLAVFGARTAKLRALAASAPQDVAAPRLAASGLLTGVALLTALGSGPVTVFVKE